MTLYTLGFVFDFNLERVLLIHKNRPDWQVGKINGLGGKVEERETPASCVAREIEEESSLKIGQEKWVTIATIDWIGRSLMTVFAAIWEGEPGAAQTITDEQVEWFDITQLPENCISNLHWLIPLCKDKLLNGKPTSVTATYNP